MEEEWVNKLWLLIIPLTIIFLLTYYFVGHWILIVLALGTFFVYLRFWYNMHIF